MCKACGHRYDRHIFGGMCLDCACQRCIYEEPRPAPNRPAPNQPTPSR